MSADFAVPGGPINTACSPATVAMSRSRMTSSLPRNRASSDCAIIARRVVSGAACCCGAVAIVSRTLADRRPEAIDGRGLARRGAFSGRSLDDARLEKRVELAAEVATVEALAGHDFEGGAELRDRERVADEALRDGRRLE